jgi:DNA-binding LytR/AlgR family response regulator
MKTIIIEDETPASEKLIKSLKRCDPDISVLAVLSSIQSSVEWLKNNSYPELIFMDIELSDGHSFKIFEQVDIKCPVIFTTAFDEYWQEAFEHNSIDYLLKPIKDEKLASSLQKFERMKQHFEERLKQLQSWRKENRVEEYKKRFLVKRGIDFFSIKATEVAYFYATHKLVCMVDAKGQKFILDKSLTDLEEEVDPSMFYRVNRKYLVNMDAIKKISSQGKGKLLLEIQPAVGEEIIISPENAPRFKDWIST